MKYVIGIENRELGEFELWDRECFPPTTRNVVVEKIKSLENIKKQRGYDDGWEFRIVECFEDDVA